MQKIKITNERVEFVTLWLEPWGEDYGMSANDDIEIVATDAGEGFYFHILNEEKGVRVYAEGHVTQIFVSQNGGVLSCGHNRRKEMW